MLVLKFNWHCFEPLIKMVITKILWLMIILKVYMLRLKPCSNLWLPKCPKSEKREPLISVLKKKKKKEKNIAADFKCTMPPDFRIPCGLSSLYKYSLTSVAQDKPYHKKPLIRDCCNHKGSCTLFRPYLTITAWISSSSFVQVSMTKLAMSSLSKGISSTLIFHESIGTDGIGTRNFSYPKRALSQLSKLD